MLKTFRLITVISLILVAVATSFAQDDEQLKKALLEAAKAGNAPKVKELLDQGAFIAARDEQTGKTALHLAVASGNVDSINHMLYAYRSFTIDKASFQQMKPEDRQGWINGLKDFVLDRDGNTPLVDAIKGGKPEVLQLVLSAGFMTPDLVNLPNNSTNPVLLETVKQGDLNMVRLLIENGANVNATDSLGVTALMHAANMDRVDIASLLIEKGANVNVKTKSGWPILAGIAEKGPSTEIVRLLLEKGANVNEIAPQGATALLQNLRSNRQTMAVLQLMLDKGANVNAADIGGTTPLHRAAFHPNGEEFVKLLLDRNANPNLKNNAGQTPLTIAIKSGNTKSADLLKARGGQ
ncbi:MAG TPA: ankyrin repeat domain-containing protein [Acidobacteriota bacterium]|nr:ankyrin repeat domain-containing protein [Acidobacteriota bacterium]